MVVSTLSGQMEKLEELLPGIEEFLCTDLAEECLSDSAEEKRQYFIERLDILKLPPSIPPRRPVSGIKSSPLPVTIPVELNSPTEVPDNFFENDFAAHQREISRSLVSNDKNETEGKEVKVYDDIDTGQGPSQPKSDETTDEHDGINFYEIPVVKQTQAPVKSDDTDGYEETKVKKEDTETREVTSNNTANKDGEPPPLPPRRERTTSDAHSRSSVGSLLDDKPPDLPLRPNLPSKLEMSNMSENERQEKGDIKSDKSDEHTDDFTDDPDATSYESYDEQEHDLETMNKLDIKLPKPLKKTKKHKKLSKSRSSKEWDINLPYNCLEDVTLSGELHYKGKLSWTKKIAALSDGRMICYKPEKTDAKPALVIQLVGYQAAVSEKEHKKGFDIKLTHPELEIHSFSIDFKEWAQTWCDYICAMAQGKQPPGQYYHLARTTTFTTGLDNTYSSKHEHGTSMSNISTASSDGLDLDYSSSSLKRRNKKHSRVKRVGSIVFRATQFLESVGKKSGKTGKKSSFAGTQSPSLTNLRERSSSSGSTPLTPILTPMSAPDTPVFPLESPDAFHTESFDCHIQHKGHLNIYSSFNKRKWGRRWCLVRDNRFECYRNETSTICELDFLLKNCILQRAVEETKSQLGLMLLEQKCEKITVEPLSSEEMGRWLKVLMNETSTENLPEGLSEFWIEEDESPYHDIKPQEITSLKSHDHSPQVVDKSAANCQSSSPYEQSGESPNSDGNKTLTLSSLETTTDSATLDTSQFSANSVDNSNSYIPGDVTGDLYTQVRKNSVTDELCEIRNNEEFAPLIGSTFIESQRSYRAHVEHTSQTSWTSSLTSSSKSSSFFLTDSDMKEGSLFAEIVTNINKRFSEHDSDNEEPSSETQTDTAYNSASCSENSSLERKNRTDSNSLTHSQNDLDSLSQSTDRQTSPIEDSIDISPNERIIEIQVLSPQNSCPENTAVQKYSENKPFTDLKSNERTLLVERSEFIDVSKTEVIHNKMTLSRAKSSREQCDSAIFEGESILEDEESVNSKIEQLRTHLVELKKNRILVRDRKKDTDSPSVRLSLEDEYNRLDEECRTLTDEITLLESQQVR